MKVCLINNLYKPYWRGGAERVVEMTVQGLRERGHEVFVISASPNPRSEKCELHTNDSKRDSNDSNYTRMTRNLFSEPPELKGGEEELENIKIYRIWSPNLIFYGNLGKLPLLLRLIWHFLDMFNFAAAWKVRKIVKREKPDMVFLHNLKGLSYLIPKFLRNENLVLVPHDTQLIEPSGTVFPQRNGVTQPKRNLVTRCLYANINRFLFSNIKKVIFPSQWLLEFYASYGFFKEAKQIVLHNPALPPPQAAEILNPKSVPTQIVRDLPTQMVRDPDRSIGTDRSIGKILNLLFVGQLEESKGVLFLINFLKEGYNLPRPSEASREGGQATNYKLTIVGDGSKRGEVERLIVGDERFQYLGRLEGEALQKVYREADFTVVPSLVYENCPTVILESFASGTPVIAARIGGIPELVRDGENGFLFEPGSSESLGQILNNVNKNNWTDLSQQCKIKAEAHELDKYINLLINFIHEEGGKNALERERCKMCE